MANPQSLAPASETRPIIRLWPLPLLRPKRAASGVAGLRYGSGQRKPCSNVGNVDEQTSARTYSTYLCMICSVSSLVIGAPGSEWTAPTVSGCFFGMNWKGRRREAAGRRNYPEAVPNAEGGSGEYEQQQVGTPTARTRCTTRRV
jgi:hypothetical protein